MRRGSVLNCEGEFNEGYEKEELDKVASSGDGEGAGG